MIISKLSGGLGNQMFQYARGLALAKQKNTTLKLDLSFYKKDNRRVFSLSSFNISSKEANFFEKLIVKIFSPSSYLQGYFQNEKYFERIKDIIREEFQPKESIENKFPDLVNDIKNSNSVSVHVRRTDYLNKQHQFIILGIDYYTKAINKIEKEVSNPKYYFFSDDVEWTKENIPHQSDSVFIAGKDVDDIHLMALCKHNITANSTFSWWSAWLNLNVDKIVISPRKWFTDDANDKSEIIIEGWLLL